MQLHIWVFAKLQRNGIAPSLKLASNAETTRKHSVHLRMVADNLVLGEFR